jgi:hypothetical protein
VLWTGNPLSVYSHAGMTMVDGIFYFDEATDKKLKDEMDIERNRIIANILRESQSAPSSTPNFSRR